MSLKIRSTQARLDEGVEHGDSWEDKEGRNVVVSLQKVVTDVDNLKSNYEEHIMASKIKNGGYQC